jgi:hypothetical protein
MNLAAQCQKIVAPCSGNCDFLFWGFRVSRSAIFVNFVSRNSELRKNRHIFGHIICGAVVAMGGYKLMESTTLRRAVAGLCRHMGSISREGETEIQEAAGTHFTKRRGHNLPTGEHEIYEQVDTKFTSK